MEYLKLSKWESNVIQVGLDHILDEFEVISEDNRVTAKNLKGNLTTYQEKSFQDYAPIEMKRFSMGCFGVYHYEKTLITMAVTEIYLMHIDLKNTEYVEDEDAIFTEEILSACKSIFDKLLKGDQ
tara:strand:- start:173 stop:547 length:375 start_codon:yes stop_codon:yes gene_type:complete